MDATTAKLWPLLTIGAVLFPALGVGAAFYYGNRTPGLGAILVFAAFVLAGVALGAICAGVALARGEPWRAVQLLALVANLAIVAYAGARFLQPKPAPPLLAGPSAYMALAPESQRFGERSIGLAYPASDSAATQRGYVIGTVDARGVVTSLRTADWAVPLAPGEVRLQLAASNGHWTVARDADRIREITDGEWRSAAYVEIRPTLQGWNAPVGIADLNLRPLSPPR